MHHMHMYLNSVDNTFQTKMSEARRAKRGVNTSNASLKPSYEKPVKQMDTFVEKPVTYIRFICPYFTVFLYTLHIYIRTKLLLYWHLFEWRNQALTIIHSQSIHSNTNTTTNFSFFFFFSSIKCADFKNGSPKNQLFSCTCVHLDQHLVLSLWGIPAFSCTYTMYTHVQKNMYTLCVLYVRI